MINLFDQLKKYPEEFIRTIDIAKYKYFDIFLTDALKKHNVLQEFNKMNQDDKDGLYELLKRIYAYGFYNGVSFTLNPNEYLKDSKPNEK